MASGGPPRIVVVGDPDVEGLVDRLEATGADVAQAADVDETLSELAAGGVGAVVSTADLPQAGGATLCGEIRIRELGVPFVLCGPRERDVDELAAAGGVDFVVSTGSDGISAVDLATVLSREAVRYLEDAEHDEAWAGYSDVGRDAIDALGASDSVDGYERTDDGKIVVAEERLARLERDSEMLGSVLESVPASVYFKDLLGRHERVSDWQTFDDPEDYETNAEGKVHPMPADFVGKTDFDLYPHSSIEEAVTDDRRVMMTGEPTKDKIGEARDVWGNEQFFSTTKAPRYDDEGNVIGLVGITTNVTERVHSERELQRQNERLSEFADVLAHDLRNPLNVARGHLDIASEESPNQNLDVVQESLARMERLIEEVLTYAREGRSVDDLVTLSLFEVSNAAWQGVETADASLALGTELTFRADPDRLQRLLENLFRNAVEHGGDAVTVEVGALDPGIGFYVEDDGPGLPDDVEQVFERGFTTQVDGTGFGLSIVQNIASAHGWSVTALDAADSDATDDVGARFEIRDVNLVRPDVSGLPEF